jgi:hypothetical protein
MTHRPFEFENPPAWPNPKWTPKQEQNWIDHIEPVYSRIESELGRRIFRAVWRPKKRGDGWMKREHVKLGTPEDYVEENVSDLFTPMTDITSVMMRQVGRYDVSRETLDEAVDAIRKARLKHLADNNPERARQLLANTAYEASLYGVGR